MSPSTFLTGAAPAWVADRLVGDLHRGQVVHAGADALYFESHGEVIGVLSRHATPVPCAIATRAHSLDDLFERSPRVGDLVEVGQGTAALGAVRIRVGRHVDYRLRPFSRARAAQMASCLESHADLSPGQDEIGDELLELLRRRPAAALPQVIGRGSGLTPFGDDVTCGLLATLLAADDPCAPKLRAAAVAQAPGRTTRLSTTLLRRAGEGDALPAFAALVSALTATSAADPAASVAATAARLLTVGHTSGAGMLLGLQLALAHINTRSCP